MGGLGRHTRRSEGDCRGGVWGRFAVWGRPGSLLGGGVAGDCGGGLVRTCAPAGGGGAAVGCGGDRGGPGFLMG